MTIYKHELNENMKSFLIWMLSVAGMCFGCILMYASVENSLGELGDAFSNMGAMSAALGMDRISINTLTGYYATEIAMIHSLGGAMFAAILGSNLLSKEEYGHTAEFLLTFPVSRGKVVMQKLFAMITILTAFQACCSLLNMLGFAVMKEEIEWEHMLTLSGLQLLLFVEIAAITFCISAFSKRNKMGVGLGITLIAFSMDLMCRIIPAIEDVKYVVPFYYVNATDIYTDAEFTGVYYIVAIAVILVSICVAYYKYNQKDISA